MPERRLFSTRQSVIAACARKSKKADAWAQWMKSTILEIEAKGHTSNGAIARELNQRKIPNQRGGTWYPARIRELRERLELPNPHATGVPAK
jgi:hypothetical protein